MRSCSTAEEQPGTRDDRGILASYLSADGRYQDHLYVDGGPSATQTAGHLRMNGREVFRFAVAEMAAAADNVLAQAGWTRDDLDWLVLHQANLRIIDAVAKRLGLPSGKMIVTVDQHANTSAASIPLALDAAVVDGRHPAGPARLRGRDRRRARLGCCSHPLVGRRLRQAPQLLTQTLASSRFFSRRNGGTRRWQAIR